LNGTTTYFEPSAGLRLGAARSLGSIWKFSGSPSSIQTARRRRELISHVFSLTAEKESAAR
jgi:hypothetical protein